MTRDTTPTRTISIRPRRDATAERVLDALRYAGAREVALYEGDGFRVIRSQNPIHDERDVPDYRWHVSVSREDRLPTWTEFAELVHRVRPGVVFCMALPPRSWWINLHDFCLHADEVKDPNLITQWKAERRGDTPT